MSQKTKLAFIASVVLNVLLVGVLIGQSPRRFDRSAMREQRMEQVIKDLPEASQTRLRERFKQLRAAAEPLFEQIRKSEADTVELLGKEPFDEPAYDLQVSKIIGMRLEMTKKLSQVVKDASKDLSADERSRFAQLLRRPAPPKP
ncbi:MAG: periplasmic heavy metal sensor [Candidatus Binatia bacterium]|nr:periplasmic heavy metal sensor [Candidatus Binatia bacterium]